MNELKKNFQSIVVWNGDICIRHINNKQSVIKNNAIIVAVIDITNGPTHFFPGDIESDEGGVG